MLNYQRVNFNKQLAFGDGAISHPSNYGDFGNGFMV